MKRIFKWLPRLIALLVVMILLLLVFKDSMLRAVAENCLRTQTGMEVKIGKFSSALFSPVVTLENLRLYNTAEFGGTPCLNIAELHVECDTVALTQHRLRIKLARLNATELEIVKNEAGRTNWFSLISGLRIGNGSQLGLKSSPGGFEFDGIETLNLSLHNVHFIDLKDPKNNHEVRVDLQNQVFRNVKSEADLSTILFIAWLKSGGGLR